MYKLISFLNLINFTSKLVHEKIKYKKKFVVLDIFSISIILIYNSICF